MRAIPARMISIFLLLTVLILFTSCITIPGQVSETRLVPRIDTFEAKPSVIDTGDVTYLDWKVTNANSVFINNEIGSVAIKGTLPVSPNVTTVYTLTATNFAGQATANTQVIVNSTQSNEPELPEILIFEADRISILSGESVRLKWNVARVTDVTITHLGQFTPQGSIEVAPSQTTEYVLVATNAIGQSTALITIEVDQISSIDDPNMITTVLHPLVAGSGSLIKGTGYLSYTKYNNICAGDTAMNMASRAFLTFDISTIPHDAVISQAILEFGDYTKKGDPSYSRSMWGNMGALGIYYIDYEDIEESSLSAYNKTGKLVANGMFDDYPLSPWTIDVANSDNGEPVVQDLIHEGKPNCQFRIQFFSSTNWDSVSDMLCFDGAYLTIKYKTK